MVHVTWRISTRETASSYIYHGELVPWKLDYGTYAMETESCHMEPRGWDLVQSDGCAIQRDRHALKSDGCVIQSVRYAWYKVMGMWSTE